MNQVQRLVDFALRSRSDPAAVGVAHKAPHGEVRLQFERPGKIHVYDVGLRVASVPEADTGALKFALLAAIAPPRPVVATGTPSEVAAVILQEFAVHRRVEYRDSSGTRYLLREVPNVKDGHRGVLTRTLPSGQVYHTIAVTESRLAGMLHSDRVS